MKLNRQHIDCNVCSYGPKGIDTCSARLRECSNGLLLNHCPVCDKSVDDNNNWVKCPQYKISICMDHCYEGCPYLNRDISITSCRYKNNNIAISQQIKEIKEVTL